MSLLNRFARVAVPLCALIVLLGLVASPLRAQDVVADILLGNGAAESEAEPAPGSISVESDAAMDSRIERRIRAIFAEIEALQSVDVSVSEGVVSLSGELLSNDNIRKAESIASQVQGVVEVLNGITLVADVGERIDDSVGQIQHSASSLLSRLPVLLAALVVMSLGWFIGRFLARRSHLLARITPNRFIAELLGGVVWFLVTLFGIFLGLGLLDATGIIGTVLGAAGILGLAVGFAVKDTVENYVSSVLLSLRHPFKARDYVSIDGIEGSVARLTTRSTMLVTADGNHVSIPNATVFKAVVTNFTRNPQRRFEFQVGVDTELSIAQAQTIGLDVLDGMAGVLDDPAPAILVDSLGDSSVLLLVRGWVDQRSHDLTRVRSEAIRLLKRAYDENGIVMPEPIYKIRLEGQAAATAAATEAPKRASLTPDEPMETVTETATETDIQEALEEAIQAEGDDVNLLNDEPPA